MFIEVAGYFENRGKSKQNSFLKSESNMKCMSMRLFLASASFYPKFLLLKLIPLVTYRKQQNETGYFCGMTLHKSVILFRNIRMRSTHLITYRVKKGGLFKPLSQKKGYQINLYNIRHNITFKSHTLLKSSGQGLPTWPHIGLINENVLSPHP